MDRAEFDRFADEYEATHGRNIRVSGETPEFFARYKIEDLARECAGRRVRSILDFGGGIGNSVPHFRRLFPQARIVCLDVSERSLDIARRRDPGGAEYRLFDGLRLPFASGYFDVVFAACVFHHVDVGRQLPLLRELHRVLACDGHLQVFEHNPLNPLTRAAVHACPFDERAVLIRAGALRERIQDAGFARARIVYRIFFPHVLRALRPLEAALARLPLGAQYYICAAP